MKGTRKFTPLVVNARNAVIGEGIEENSTLHHFIDIPTVTVFRRPAEIQTLSIFVTHTKEFSRRENHGTPYRYCYGFL